MLIRTVASLAVLACLASAWEPNMHLGRVKGGMKGVNFGELTEQAPQIPASGFGATESFMLQNLDHFNANDNRTWSQRYFSNTQFNKGGNVVFLMLGGEGPENINWVSNENYPYIGWAKEFGALVFDLEHRFYGQSRPFPTQTVDDLKYLSSRQAIQDVAVFIKFINNKYGLKDPRWITFGGSYSGALSLWAREMLPNLVAGAVGSSAPVQATFDFYKYLTVVEASLNRSSKACADNVKAGFQAMQTNMATPEGRDTLSTTFNLKPTLNQLNLTYNDIQNFYTNIYGNFQGAVQYSGDNMGPFATGYGITEVCAIMAPTPAAGTPLENLAKVNVLMNQMNGVNVSTDGTANSYQDMVNYLLISNYSGNGPSYDSGARSWTWQTCTEFGYFQSTDAGENGIFGAVTPNNLFINLCQDVFGPSFGAKFIADSVDSTNVYFGGADGYRGTNVVMPNGNVDPWHVLGKSSSVDPSVVPYLIDGTAHCADMYPPRAQDQPGLAVVRNLIKVNLDDWINAPLKNVTIGNPVPVWQRPPSASAPIQSRNKRDVLRPEGTPDISSWATKFQKFNMGRPPHGFNPAPVGALPDFPVDYESGFFTQRVDHFDNTNPATFKQQYFKNGQWAKPGGPIFLMIGGEGPESNRWVLNENITYLTWAKKYGATVYLLEHRYYGLSTINQKNPDGSENLKYLSSIQMLYDLAAFIKAVNFKVQTGNNTWVTFGGSYSGAMSLWMREVFPDLVVGAVGSSGPVQAKLDFYEYLQVVEASIRTYSQDCANNIKVAFDLMHTMMMKAEGRKQLSDIFTLVPPFTAVDPVTDLQSQFFFSNIYGNFQGAVQYSGDNSGAYANGYGIPDMCKFMNNPQNQPLQNVVEFNKYMTAFYSGANFTQTDNSYDNFIAYLKTANTISPGDAAAKYWTYQTCTEFGYFQSTDLGYGIFGSPTPVNMFTQMCTDVFGSAFTAASVDASIAATNQKYGGRDNYRGTNVVMPNGSLDPWHALGKYTSSDPSVVHYLINGTAHCADMYPARAQDVPDLAYVRNTIEVNLAKWINAPLPATLAPATNPPGTGPTTTSNPANTANSTTTTTTLAPPTTKSGSVTSLFVAAVFYLISRY